MKTTHQLWFRFSALASLFVLVAWMVASTLTFLLFQSRLRDALDSSLELSAGQALAVINIEDGALNLNDALPDFTRLGTVLEGGFLVQIFDPAEKLILSSGKMDIGQPPLTQSRTDRVLFSSPPDTPEDKEFRAIAVPILVDGTFMGILRIFRGTVPVREALERLLATLGIVLPFFVIITFFGSAWIARRSLSPVDRMIDQALRISESDLSLRLPVLHLESEVGRLAAVFNAMLSRLESAFAKERRFTADAAHELRTPLNAIHAILGTTLSRSRNEEVYKKALTDIGQQASRLTNLTNDLLFLAREPSRTTDEPFDLWELIEDVIGSLEPLALEKGLTLRGIIRGTATISGDRDSLARALFNVVGNGIRYTERGGVTVTLSYLSTGAAVVDVEDTGIGIPQEHLPHIFERFYRGTQSRTDGGSGLGLALAHEIISRHRGRIEVASGNSGSNFRLFLPTFDKS